MSLAPSALCLFAALLVVVSVSGKPQSPYELEAPISAYKRFYSWEDAKRGASIESEEGMRNKRKQFYAWAGKRSSAPVHFFEDAATAAAAAEQQQGPSMEKRKQFYAWAGK
ncbi:unnamed protein product [Caenorhabditis sp. 36 PRJEB53466]|nr:unnamed protein product [Caenorhabditis sp. 36 PRJEB53466]